MNWFSEVMRRADAARHRTRIYKGRPIPESAGVLLDKLREESDPIRRSAWYAFLSAELELAGNHDLDVAIAEQRLNEFGDSLSLKTYSRALLRAGRTDEAFAAADAAIEQDIAEGEFINDAVLSAVRLAVESGDRHRIDTAVRRLLELFVRGRVGDLRFEDDWIESAQRLGADAALLDEVVRRFGP